ncbi:MAG: prolyl oligopeptidase family serine peptidase [Vicinamibacterales bacterium]
MRRLVVVLLLVGGAAVLSARQPAPFPLTVDSIMRGPELVGYPPSNLRWSGDAQRLYFEWQMPLEDEPVTWVVPRTGGRPERLNDAERELAPLPTGTWDRARRRILGVDRGDIVVIDTVANTRIQVTRTTDSESNPRWTPDETHVTFVRDNNLFLAPVGDAGDGALRQLTDVGPRASSPKPTDSQKFVRSEEDDLIEIVKERKARREREQAQDYQHALPRFELAERERVVDAALSAGGTFVYLLVGERPQARTANVPAYVTESGYTEDIPARSKVGDDQEDRRLAVLNLTTREARWIGLDGVVDTVVIPAHPPSDDPAPPRPTPKPTRASRWQSISLSPDARVLTALVRSADNNDRWLVKVDPASGGSSVLDHVHDDAWVREGGSGWLPDSRRVWFLAEHDGWMHLYTVDATAATPGATQLTSGRFEIDDVEVSPDGQRFYISSTEAHPGERQLYSLSVDGGARTRLTTAAGAHAGVISPDNEVFGLVSSTASHPPEVYVMANRAGADASQVTESTSMEWRSHKWVEPQLVTYTTRDGQTVYARLYTPEMVGARRNRSAPAVVFVHGAGYLQNAHRYWSTYYREYMFHHLLASRGYVVLDPDYRASAGYGRDWRTAIYRWMGGHDLDDVVDGAAYLVKEQRVDPKRIGVYGGSYGGFITLMAMFTSPDTFAAGAALRPVTDWAHYNHGYTSNILNEPQEDAEAYRKSSPIYFAEGLKGRLLICHGMVDTNVHFQDSVRLVQRLIELRKENWELAVFPMENHGFVEQTSWADEYKRILRLFETTLK